ncbi:DUF5050 domain-containing protein [Clostridium bovifaecis]|uniref:DUF5050 domain-containing protein n=1 Tax=Clostridium bovifaecis TaxID=2184719 RepID=A0A6I6EQ49_9CLOT|nr:DUF5050 domain-containing protein [Clostridium bovifaecis]
MPTIIKNGEYEAYFIYSKDGERIRKLLGDEYHNPNFKRSTEITYYSGDGSQHIYKWNETAKEYKLVPAAVFADITPGSSNGLVNITAKSVNAVPGAVYYKLKHSNNIKKIGDTTTFISSSPLEEISILSSNETVLAKGVLDVSKDVSKYYSLMTITETLGTTAGNSNNNGSFVINQDLDTIYRNTGDNKTMYKKDLTGSIDHQISLDNAQYINALGQWIYYSNYSDDAKIYKVKKDGTGRQKICDDKATYIIVSGNQIFYSNHSDKGRLYVINTDGTGGTTDSAGNIHGRPVMTSTGSYDKSAYDEVSYINVIGDWIYYSNVSDGHKIYVVNKDGTARRKVNDEWADGAQIEGDWAYYASARGVLSKARKDGTGSVVPIRGMTTEVDKGYHLNVVGDWLYYSSAEDEGKLYKIRTDGSGEKYKLSDLKTDYINIIGDWIYIVTSNQTKTYMLPIDTDGSVQPKLVTKNSLDSKIVKVDNIKKFVDYDDVTLPLKTLELKYLPPKVPALMTDDTYKEVTVSWDTENVKYKDGVYTYTGTILGYGQKIILELNIPSQMLNDTNKVILNNNGGANDTIEVIGTIEGKADSVRLKAGDIISVYKEEACTTLLGKGTVGADRKVVISKLKLDPYGESIYLTVKREKKGESKPTKVDQISAPIVDSINVDDEDDEGLGIDGRDFIIKKWVRSELNKNVSYDGEQILAQSIYILPNKTLLDMRTQKTAASSKDGNKALSVVSTNWTGSKLMNIFRDSKGVVFKNGMYDLYVSTEYTCYAAPDSSGNKPFIEGSIASDAPGTMTVKGEEIPKEPSITTQRYKGGSTISLNLQLKDGEDVYLVPIEYINRFTGWKKEDGLVDPFTDEYKAGVLSTGRAIELIAPPGIDPSYLNYRDRAYKLFIKNSVGVSNPSRGNIIVDNKAPQLQIDSLVSLPYGATVRYTKVTNSSESTKDTISSPDVYTTYLVAENYFDEIMTYSQINDLQLLNTRLKSLVSAKDAVQSTGNTIATSTLKNVEKASAKYGTGFNTNNYRLFTIDKSGNISNVVPMTIWKDTSSLDDIMLKGNAALDALNNIDPSTDTTVWQKINSLKNAMNTAIRASQNANSTQDVVDREVINLLNVLKTVSSGTDKTYFTDYATLYNYYIAVNKDERIKSNFSGIINLPRTSNANITTTWPGDINGLLNHGDSTLELPAANQPTVDTYVDYSGTFKISGIPELTLIRPIIFTLKKSNPSNLAIDLYGETGNEIYTSGGVLQMIAKPNVKDVTYKNLQWEVTNTDGTVTDKATIDQYGILKANKNGTVKVKVTEKVSGISAEREILLSEQKFKLTTNQITLQPYNSGGTVKYRLIITNINFYKDANVDITKNSDDSTIRVLDDKAINLSDNSTINGISLNTNVRNQISIDNLDIKDEDSISIKLTSKASGEFISSDMVEVPVP